MKWGSFMISRGHQQEAAGTEVVYSSVLPGNSLEVAISSRGHSVP